MFFSHRTALVLVGAGEESCACFRINRLQLGLLSKGFRGQLAGLHVRVVYWYPKMTTPQIKSLDHSGGLPISHVKYHYFGFCSQRWQGVHLLSSVLPTLFKRDLETYDEEEPNVP